MKKLAPYILVLAMLASCKDEPVPAYLKIDSISVAARSYEGSSSSNIADVWVYQNFNLQGAYELPAEFPILAEGPTSLVVYGGIKLSGISSLRAIYPFYDPDTINVTFIPGQTVSASPVVRYTNNAVFDFIESFENANNFDNVERITGADVGEGSYSGQIIADTVTVFAISNTSYEIPFNSTAVFLELDYKNTHVFDVGVIAISGSDTAMFEPKISMPPREEWNKQYINLTPEVNGIQADEYLIYFRLQPGAEPGQMRIFIDNVKLIHARV